MLFIKLQHKVKQFSIAASGVSLLPPCDDLNASEYSAAVQTSNACGLN